MPGLHLGHRLVRRVAVDHHHHLGVVGEVAFGDLVAATGVQSKHHRVIAQEDPQPPLIPALAVLGDKDHPARLVGLGERRLSVPRQQGVVERLKQGFEALQAGRDGAGGHVQIELPPGGQQPLGGTVAEVLLDEGSPPTRTPPTTPWGSAWAAAER